MWVVPRLEGPCLWEQRPRHSLHVMHSFRVLSCIHPSKFLSELAVSLSLFVCQLWYLSIWGDQQTNNPFCEITLQDPHYLMKTDDRKQLHTPTKLMHKLPFPLWSHSLTSNNFSFTTSCLSWLPLLSLGIPVATVPRCSRRRRQMAAESGRRFPCRQENTNSGDLESISLSCAELLQRQPLKPGSLILQCIWMS